MATQPEVQQFREVFRAREDIHAERYTKKNGESGYGPVCENKFQKDKGCKIEKGKSGACNGCQAAEMVPLSDEIIREHLAGNTTRGIYPLLENNTCWFIAVDFDADEDNPEEAAQAFEEVKRLHEVCRSHELPVYVERSRSGVGFHMWMFLEAPIPAWKPRLLVREGLLAEADIDPKKGKFDRLFPSQDSHMGKGMGNLIALPFQGSLVAEGRSVFLNPEDDYKPFADQWAFLEQIERIPENKLDELMDAMELKKKKSSSKSKSQPSTTSPASEEEGTADPQLMVERCAFLRHFRDDAKALEEPHWWSGLTLLARCVNGRQLAHEWSAPYPDYDPSETDAKLEQVLAAGPHTCQYIRDQLNFEGCQDCTANVKTPLQLGIVWEGILEAGGRYVRRKRSRKGEPIDTPISSFTIRAIERIWIEGKEGVKVDLVAGSKVYPNTVIERDAWNSRERFLGALPSIDCQFEGTDYDVQKILALVARQETPTRQGTRKLGFHSSVWLIGERGINGEGWIEHPQVVYTPHGGVVTGVGAHIAYRTLPDDEYSALIRDLAVFLPEVNIPVNMVLCIGWFMACAFKPLIADRVGHFPILNCWGTRGSGKSTLLRLMTRLCGLDGKQLFSCTGTEFTTLSLLDSTTSIPIVMDEYKPHDMPPVRVRALTRFLRRVYDGDLEFKGRPTLSSIPFSLTAPVALAGEMGLSESALLERIIPLRLSPVDIQGRSGPQGAMIALSSMPLEGFIDRYIQHVYQSDFPARWSAAEHTVEAIIGGRAIPPRIKDNMTVAAFGWLEFVAFCAKYGAQVDPSVELEPALNHVMAELLEGGEQTKTAADQLLETLSVLAETGRLGRNVHYVIRGATLGLRLESCLAEFRKYVRETQANVEVLDKNAYLQQFREMATRGGYVTDSGKNIWMGTDTRRCVIVDRDKAAAAGLDLQGFTEASATAWGESQPKKLEPVAMSEN